jgi:DNA-binding transcriptional LysR family regulator
MRAPTVCVESILRMTPMTAIDVDSRLEAAAGELCYPAAGLMKLSGIDTNLLVSLDALLQEKSVTRAAKRLGVGQPAVSHSLARLREHFRDPLLVLKGRTYVLTPRALQLAGAVANATRALADVFGEPPAFVAATSSQRFVVACSDVLGVILVPELLKVIGREAANVEFELRPIPGQSTDSILDDDVDLGVGIFEDVPPTMNQQALYDDPAVCVVRASHQHVGKRLTLETYTKLPHLEVALTRDAMRDLRIDRALAAIGKRRHVAVRVPYFLLAPQVLERTDFVATMAARAGQILARMARLRVVEPPLGLPPYRFSQVWRADRNDDRAHAWLRQRVARICDSRGSTKHYAGLSTR